MLPEVEKLTPRPSDVLLVYKPRVESDIIHVEEDPESQDLQHFVIARLGKDVRSVCVGEIAVVSWQRVTTPIDATFDGEKVKIGFTDEKEILAILEEE